VTRRPLPLVLLVALLGAGPARSAPDDPAAWLERMAVALEQVSYSGTLVEVYGSGASVVRVVHRYDGGVATERLTAVDDVGREIIHRGSEVTAILPDRRQVLVDRRDDPAGTAGAGPISGRFAALAVPAAHYRLAARPGGELLGRSTRLIDVRPLDALRYGYRLWLDEATAVPLKVEVVGTDGVVLEQVVFAEIHLGEPIAPAAVEPSVTTEGFAVRREPARPRAAPGSDTAGADWAAARLPPGFALRATRAKSDGAGEASLVQLVYSDGVASVSVFVEPDATAVAAGAGEGAASRVGADSVYSRLGDGWRITAMGEVPPQTAEMIALAVRPVAP
jgi:sigma-E factor negative regulatory protein RseB